MQVVVDEALVAYERALFWEAFDEGYRRLGADDEAWSEIGAERRAEEGAVRDGLS